MTTRNVYGSAVRANAKNRVKYLFGKVLPRVFGQPFHMQIDLIHADGTISRKRVYNTVTTVGKQDIAEQILAAPAATTKPTHMAIGTGTGGTTTLAAEIDRNALTSKTRSGAVVTMVGDWAAGDGTGALTEAGVLCAAAASDMWLYTTFAVVNKGASDALQITWTLTIS